MGGRRLSIAKHDSSKGVFITFEGGEGAGKTTQLQALAQTLRYRSIEPVVTREPGGTAGAEAIRALVLDGTEGRWSAPVETLMMAAARLDHVERLIQPSLFAGKWVLCDRFIDSTIVYQGIAGGVGVERVEALHHLFLSATTPELTILLDLPVRSGLERRLVAGGASRFEAKGLAYHERVRAGFLELASHWPERIVVVDGSAPLEIVAGRVATVVLERFAERLPSVPK